MYQLTQVEQTTLVGSSALSSTDEEGGPGNGSNEEKDERKEHGASMQTDQTRNFCFSFIFFCYWAAFFFQDLGYVFFIVPSVLLGILTVVSTPCSNETVEETNLYVGLATVIASALALQACSLMRQFRRDILSSVKPGVDQTIVNAIKAEEGVVIKRKVVKKSVVRYINGPYFCVIAVFHGLMAGLTLGLSICMIARQPWCTNPTTKQSLENRGRFFTALIILIASSINLGAYQFAYFSCYFNVLWKIYNYIRQCFGMRSKETYDVLLPLTVAIMNYHGYKARCSEYSTSRADNFDDTDAPCCVNCCAGYTHVVTQLPLAKLYVSAMRIEWRVVEEETINL